MTPDQKEAYEERAAIMEFDGGMTRKEAERRAMELFHNPERKVLARRGHCLYY